MSRSYTPGLKILSCTKIVKNRQLPIKGSVHLKIGDLVKLKIISTGKNSLEGKLINSSNGEIN